jgi:hypothetical protein
VYGTVAVREPRGDGFVLLGGFEVEGFARILRGGSGLELTNDLGFVRVEDCTIRGGYGEFSALCSELGDGGAGVEALGNARVVLTRCNRQRRMGRQGLLG